MVIETALDVVGNYSWSGVGDCCGNGGLIHICWALDADSKADAATAIHTMSYN